MGERFYYVYIVASRSRVLYVGMTNVLLRRVHEHRQNMLEGFTKTYRVSRLVYFEQFRDVRMAIAREKQIKTWSRKKKVDLIHAANPLWADLAAPWFERASREAADAVRKREALMPPRTSQQQIPRRPSVGSE